MKNKPATFQRIILTSLVSPLFFFIFSLIFTLLICLIPIIAFHHSSFSSTFFLYFLLCADNKWLDKWVLTLMAKSVVVAASGSKSGWRRQWQRRRAHIFCVVNWSVHWGFRSEISRIRTPTQKPLVYFFYLVGVGGLCFRGQTYAILFKFIYISKFMFGF